MVIISGRISSACPLAQQVDLQLENELFAFFKWNAESIRWSSARKVALISLPALILLLGCFADTHRASGQDLQPLFDQPTAEELADVKLDWSGRNTTPSDYSVRRSLDIEGFTLSRVSYVLNDLQLYGVVRFPRHYNDTGSFPVLVLLHGGFSGFWYDYPLHFDVDFPSGCIADSFLVVCPTYRGEGLAGGDLGSATSAGPTSFWDYDCDDSMAMLTAVLDNTPAADASRVVVYGQSRGGGVAYHMAARDPRVRKTVALFSPSDFRELSVQVDVQNHVDGVQDVLSPLPEKVMEEIVTPYLAGQTTLAEARHHLTAWSVINFLSAELSIQVHHGQADDLVPILHSEIVDETMRQQGAQSPRFQYHSYVEGIHLPTSLDGFELLVEVFLCSLPDDVSAVPARPLPTWLRAYPNPFTSQVVLEIADAADSEGSKADGSNPVLDIFDIRGRRVRTLSGQGWGTVRWDGSDGEGRHLPAGNYFVTLRGNPLIRPINLLLLN